MIEYVWWQSLFVVFTSWSFIQSNSNLQNCLLSLLYCLFCFLDLTSTNTFVSDLLKSLNTLLDALNYITRQFIFEFVQLLLCSFCWILNLKLSHFKFLSFCVLFFEFLSLFDHTIDLCITHSAWTLNSNWLRSSSGFVNSTHMQYTVGI